jgi:N,N'-diacetyllegionaminate synthase
MREVEINIGGRSIGGEEPALVIAEVGQAHEGSVETAHSFVDAIADAGADAVKFQTHIASMESTRDEPFRIPSNQDQTRFDYWKRMEFSPREWSALAAHATERNLIFLSSAFSVAAVQLLQEIGVPAWKVGSGEVGTFEVLDAMIATGKPILISTGMSTYEEIGRALEHCRAGGSDVALFQCTSMYPLPLEEVGLNILSELRSRFHCPVGLSDHSGLLWPAVAALSLGASIIEVHVVLDRSSHGLDASSSVAIDELRQLIEARDAISILRKNPVNKDAMAKKLRPMRELFTKSLAPVVDLPAGTVLEAKLLTSKKPGTGIPPSDLARVVGRRLRHSISADRLVRWEDLDE